MSKEGSRTLSHQMLLSKCVLDPINDPYYSGRVHTKVV